MWGTCEVAAQNQSGSRFIPTCVGNIYACRRPVSAVAVHPHVCGEHLTRVTFLQTFYRFIPTCVGNITIRSVDFIHWTVHPHVCGEHAVARESSVDHVRFIPTCVGNMHTDFSPCELIPVHPHVCGEHISTCIINRLVHGSSPRVWGTFVAHPTCNRQERFIPTCVGNMSMETRSPVYRRFIPTCVGNMIFIFFIRNHNAVHPHVCGEHESVRDLCLRFWTVHPHVCGEHALPPCTPIMPPGSSPRVWGTCQ